MINHIHVNVAVIKQSLLDLDHFIHTLYGHIISFVQLNVEINGGHRNSVKIIQYIEQMKKL